MYNQAKKRRFREQNPEPPEPENSGGMLDAYRILHYLCVRNQITNTAMAKTIICPYCGHSDYYAYQPYKGDGRNGKTEYHCNECETDFFEGDEYENKVTQMDGFVMIEMVKTKSGN